MKTKLLALILVAAGSMFAQTRFTQNEGAQVFHGGTQARTYQAATRNQSRDDNRYENSYTFNSRDRSIDRDDVRYRAPVVWHDDHGENRFRGR